MITSTRVRVAIVSAILLGAWGRMAAAQAAPVADDANSITPAMIALGDSVFHGKAGGGTCQVCHGADAKGTPGIAPGLRSGTWLQGDGSYAFIVATVEAGVPKPKKSPMPMQPMGGAKLTPAQVRAVAAYVFSLTHPAGPAGASPAVLRGWLPRNNTRRSPRRRAGGCHANGW